MLGSAVLFCICWEDQCKFKRLEPTVDEMLNRRSWTRRHPAGAPAIIILLLHCIGQAAVHLLAMCHANHHRVARQHSMDFVARS